MGLRRRIVAPQRARGSNVALARLAGRLPRWGARRGTIELGDFARRLPRRAEDSDSVYDALASSILRPHGSRGGAGLLLAPKGFSFAQEWQQVQTGSPRLVELETEDADAGLSRLSDSLAAEQLDWVTIDRCLQFVYDMPTALGRVAGWLRPGGVLVALFTGIARAEPHARRPLWTVAPYAAQRLLEGCPALDRVGVDQRGNVALALAWLYGLPASDLTPKELRRVDLAYPLVVAATGSRAGQ
jgi:hypothetical protein